MKKHCSSCDTDKDPQEFSPDKRRVSGFMSQCRECIRANNRRRHLRRTDRDPEVVRHRKDAPTIAELDAIDEQLAAAGIAAIRANTEAVRPVWGSQ